MSNDLPDPIKVLCTFEPSQDQCALLRSLLDKGVEVEFIGRERKDECVERALEFHVTIGGVIPREILEAAENLRYHIIPYAGIPKNDRENLPDFPNVTVLNSHFNSLFAAEHAWALLMASAKYLCPVHNQMKSGDWSARYSEPRSVALDGKTLLLVGYGAIGKSLGSFARAFGMKVKAVKRTPSEAPELDFLGTRDDLPQVLPEADFIIVSLPGTSGAEKYLSFDEFEMMKDGVYIVNVGRGTAIDEDAFYEALKSGKIGGAALDTMWIYPKDKESVSSTFPSKYPLDEFENVIMSPHRATHVMGREDDRMHSLAEILNSIRAGDPINVVNIQEGY